MFQGVEILKAHPRIVTLCGSTRFIEMLAIMAYELEKAGAIVLGCHYLPPPYFEKKKIELVKSHLAENEKIEAHFDSLHFEKIEMSDSIYVLNIGGYIGESTRREIAYAEKLGKPVSYHEKTIEGSA